MVRYINLSHVLMFRLISIRVRDRFPDSLSLVRSKLLLPHEMKRLDRLIQLTPFESAWAPSAWAMNLLAEANEAGKVHIYPPCMTSLEMSVEKLEEQSRQLLNYAWVNFPLAYTQAG